MVTTELWTIARLLDWTTRYLSGKNCETPRLDAEVLLSHALGCKRIELYTRHEEEPSEEQRARFKELVQQRLKGCPVAYLVGRKEFFSLEFEVNRDVLIPRPDTETVVDECLRLAKDMPAPAILDIGTGSGCLAVAAAKYHKPAQVTAVDLSAAALAVAARNAAKYGVAERIRFLEGDLYGPLPAGERFDFILSNPPYIAHGDLTNLPVGVRDFEPLTALDGGPDGYAVFDRLIAGALDRLKPAGYLIVEIGSAQEGPARQRIEALGAFDLGKTIFDGSGHPRVLRAKRTNDDQDNS
ncbi:MAG TPA: peptide chain release factor N(5)-glutamine methyltransferase [Gemmataceae bacterium]|nr:peptide chain release factor N(5)-glutamine methyltransferase [Gemmataceae bacterium]